MTGINQGTPETAIGEPIRLGSNNEFEIEQHPVSDRLIIRDTVNGKVAYVRKERGGQIGGDGVLIKALKEGKPMADDGRTHSTIQEAERAANGWVFVPPGTYNESLSIDTEGLTLRGCGYNTLIDGGTGSAIYISDNADNVSIEYTSVASNTADGAEAIDCDGNNLFVSNITVRRAGNNGINTNSVVENGATIVNCVIESASGNGFGPSSVGNCIINSCVVKSASNNGVDTANDSIFSNNYVQNTGTTAIINFNKQNNIIIGNRVTNAGDVGIYNAGDNSIIANNRVSDSTNADISDSSTGTLLDSNLTGASN